MRPKTSLSSYKDLNCSFSLLLKRFKKLNSCLAGTSSVIKNKRRQMTLSSQSSRSSSLKSVLPAPSLSWKTAATMKTNSRTLSCKTLCSRVRGPPPCKTHKFRLILRDAGVIRAMRRSTLKSAFGKAAATQLPEKPLPSSRPPSAKSSPTKTSSKTSTSNPSTCHFSPRITIQAHNKKVSNKMTLET